MSKAPLVSSVKDKKSQQTERKQKRMDRGCARTNFFSDLDVLFQAAMLAENYAAALKAKELLGKARGYFTPKKATATKTWDLEILWLCAWRKHFQVMSLIDCHAISI